MCVSLHVCLGRAYVCACISRFCVLFVCSYVLLCAPTLKQGVTLVYGMILLSTTLSETAGFSPSYANETVGASIAGSIRPLYRAIYTTERLFRALLPRTLN